MGITLKDIEAARVTMEQAKTHASECSDEYYRTIQDYQRVKFDIKEGDKVCSRGRVGVVHVIRFGSWHDSKPYLDVLLFKSDGTLGKRCVLFLDWEKYTGEKVNV